MNTKTDKSEEYNPVKEAVFAAYDFLYKKGYFTDPPDEVRRLENLLIQARVRTNEEGSQKKHSNADVQDLLHKAFYEGREIERYEKGYTIFKYPTFNGWLRRCPTVRAFLEDDRRKMTDITLKFIRYMNSLERTKKDDYYLFMLPTIRDRWFTEEELYNDFLKSLH